MAVTMNLNLSTIDIHSIKNPEEGFSPLEYSLKIATGPSTGYTGTAQVRYVNHINCKNT